MCRPRRAVTSITPNIRIGLPLHRVLVIEAVLRLHNIENQVRMSKVVSEAAWQEPQGTSYFIFSLGMDFSSFTPDLAFFSLRQNFGKRRKTTSKSVFFSIVLDRTPAAFSASIVGRSCARARLGKGERQWFSNPRSPGEDGVGVRPLAHCFQICIERPPTSRPEAYSRIGQTALRMKSISGLWFFSRPSFLSIFWAKM